MDTAPEVFAATVLSKQLKGTLYCSRSSSNPRLDLAEADDIGCSVGLIDDNDIFSWNIIFEGPSETLYEVFFSQ